jgi:hypothetical protein
MANQAAQQSQDSTVKDSHAVAGQAAGAHSQALAKLTDTLARLHAHSTQNLGQAQQMMQGPPPGMGGPDMSGGGADPQQAVWDAFPGTDPQNLAGVAGQAGDPGHALAAVVHMQQADRDKLDQMHQEQLDALLAHLSAPAGDGTTGPTGPPPDVGGELLGAA